VDNGWKEGAMKKLFLLIVLILVVAIVVYRQRIFLRDPLGKEFVNGAQVDGARVFINYSNDVLVMTGPVLEGGNPVIVQGWDSMPGHPQHMTCWMLTLACLMDNDHAAKFNLGGAGYVPKTSMTNREVDYTDEDGKAVRVVIR
jgi:hypothetical protein